MKRLMLLMACWGMLAGSVCAQTTLLTNLEAYYKLDSAGITTESHGSNTLTNNGTTGTTTGKINEAASFNGSSQYLSIADNTSLSMGDIDFSLAGWVYLNSVASTQVIAAKFNSGASKREYQLVYNSSPAEFRFQVSFNGTSSTSVSSSSYNTTGAWVYVAAGHDPTSNVIWISLNAATPSTASHSTGVFDSDSTFTIGAQHGGVAPLNGRVDELGVWKRDIRSDLADLYNSGAGLPYSSFGGGGGGNGLTYPLIIGKLTRPAPWSRFIALTPLMLEAR